jgi:hypothetical protein
VALSFEELVAMQRAADEAHARVETLRDTYGPPAATKWTQVQTDTYETAWRAWRDLARDVQDAVTDLAKNLGRPRGTILDELKQATGNPSAPHE